jgi:hypothetical protein
MVCATSNPQPTTYFKMTPRIRMTPMHRMTIMMPCPTYTMTFYYDQDTLLFDYKPETLVFCAALHVDGPTGIEQPIPKRNPPSMCHSI